MAEGSYTNFPGGVTSMGVPLVGSLGGIPFTGNWYFVDAVNGSDGNTGGAQDPLQTIPAAYAQMTDGNNDVIILVSNPLTATPTTGTFRLSSTLTWAKSACHMIGMTAPTVQSQRARISTASGATTNLSPLITISAQGCFFANFSIFQGVGQASTDECLIDITGQRNAFSNVAFEGMGSANGAGRAGSYCVYLNGAQENTFDGCSFGVDTIARTAANASVKMRNSATRNVFRSCLFPMYATASSPLFIDAGAAAAVDRFAWFSFCVFNNAINSGTGTATTAVVSSNASLGGTIIMENCTVVGSTNYSATNPDVTVKVSGPVPNGHTSGIALSAATA